MLQVTGNLSYPVRGVAKFKLTLEDFGRKFDDDVITMTLTLNRDTDKT